MTEQVPSKEKTYISLEHGWICFRDEHEHLRHSLKLEWLQGPSTQVAIPEMMPPFASPTPEPPAGQDVTGHPLHARLRRWASTVDSPTIRALMIEAAKALEHSSQPPEALRQYAPSTRKDDGEFLAGQRRCTATAQRVELTRVDFLRLLSLAERGLRAAPPPLATGCHRSHPHEGMSAECERLTEIARENNRRANEPPAGCAQCSNVAPIAKLTVRDGLAVRAGLYAPGLPDGDHDLYPAASSQPPGVDVEAIATKVVRNVCELPDYNSPDDQPELLTCTTSELHAAVVNALEGHALTKEVR